MAKALEQAIISGTGSGQALKEYLQNQHQPGQNIEIAADEDITCGTPINAEAATTCLWISKQYGV